VIILVIFLDAHQHTDGVLHRRFLDAHRLKTAFQRGILFNIFAVLRKGCGADHLNFSAGKRRLQNVRGIHRTLRITGSHQIVHLVDEQNDVPRRADFFDQPLDAAFKLAAELSSGHQRRQVKQADFFALQPQRNFSGGNP